MGCPTHCLFEEGYQEQEVLGQALEACRCLQAAKGQASCLHEKQEVQGCLQEASGSLEKEACSSCMVQKVSQEQEMLEGPQEAGCLLEEEACSPCCLVQEVQEEQEMLEGSPE